MFTHERQYFKEISNSNDNYNNDKTTAIATKVATPIETTIAIGSITTLPTIV